MTRPLTGALIGAVVALVLVYAAGAFVAWDINAAHWGSQGRAQAVLVGFAAMAAGLAFGAAFTVERRR